MPDRILEHVEKVNYFNPTDAIPKPSPEDLCLPSCLTSLAGALGQDVRMGTCFAHDCEWTLRSLYRDLIAWTGMGFGLLFHPSGCLSAVDLTILYVPDEDKASRIGLALLGCTMESIENKPENAETIRRKIVESIDRGIPVLSFGILEAPEAGLVCGYRDDGKTLVGWDYFQDRVPCEKEPNGMYRTSDWARTLRFIFPDPVHKPIDFHASASFKECVNRAIQVMELTKVDTYFAGEAAYRAWQEFILEPVESAVVKSRYMTTHILIGNHAEARCYCGCALSAFPEAAAVAQYFSDIHDLCWKAWGEVGKHSDPMDQLGEVFCDLEVRKRVAARLGEMAELDRKALAALKEIAAKF